MNTRPWIHSSIILCGLLAACGEEAGPVVIADSGTDSTGDVSDVAETDVEPDTGPDIGSDAGVDAAEDADVSPDAADVDADPEDAADTIGDTADTANDVSDAVETDAELDADDADADDADADADDTGAAPGFGEISGTCGVVGSELGEPDGSFFEASIDFGDDPFDDPADIELLTSGGLAVLEAGNSGGSSLYSEVFAFEVLARCDGATLLETERTIEYDAEHTGSITDLLVHIDDEQVGVSVTRAVGFPRDEPYSVSQASDLLTGKLEDILESSAGVVEEDAWIKQVLLVIAYADGHVDSLREALESIDAETRADTVVYVVESEGLDEWLY